MWFLACLILLYVLGFYFSPFPYWRTYWRLWRALLFIKNPAITTKARFIEARYLFLHTILVPLGTLLWYLDEWIYPQYRQRSVSPVFIIGQPRSGTTFLHRTLAADRDHFRAIRHIEWRFPFISVQKWISRSKYARSLLTRSYWSNSPAGQIASKMHPNRLSDWEEDGIFFEERFLHHFFIFLRFPYPELLTYLDDYPALPTSVQDRILKTHQRVIQKVLFLNGNPNVRYLSKEVSSHNKFPKLLQLYPDATFIFSFRRSADFMDSLLALIRYSTLSKIGVDPLEIEGWDESIIERMRKDSQLLVDFCHQHAPVDQQVRTLFSQFTEDIMATIESVYGQLGLTITETYRQHLETLHRDQVERESGYRYEKREYQGFEKFDALVEQVQSETMK